MLSKLSYMNLVMMDVFPTPWSPRNTSLYFASGAIWGNVDAAAPAPPSPPATPRRFAPPSSSAMAASRPLAIEHVSAAGADSPGAST